MQKLLLFIFETRASHGSFESEDYVDAVLYTNIRIYILRLIVTFEST